MKIRRYIGKNTQEAILKVKMDLGSEAVILNTRKIKKKGLWNAFAKPMIEVLAALDEGNVNNVEKKGKSNDSGDKEKVSVLENKVLNIEKMLTHIYEQMRNTKVQENGKRENLKIGNKIIEIFENNLIKNDVEEQIVKNIINIVKNKIGYNTSVNESARVLKQLLVGMLGKPLPISIDSEKKMKKVIFVGPTGVGKTTTLAKIAANYSLNHKKNIGLITADTYRIAAVEQLKTYAEILGLPLKVVYSANEIGGAINEYMDKDIILIDTAGRSLKNKAQADELKELIKESQADEIFLVLSATTSPKNCRDILKQYSFMEDYKLLFTKLDETPINGIILNARYLTNKSLSYITTGQSVPDDFEVVNVDEIAKNLLGSLT